MMPLSTLTFCYDVKPSDRNLVRSIVASTGYFSDAEVDVAVELVDTRLEKGLPSGYEFVFAVMEGRIVGYTCYGEIACTIGSYDLYWIAVEAKCHRRGLGSVLLHETERLIREKGGRRIYIETSNRPQYLPTRGFYDRNHYRCDAVLHDFYAPGDDKVIYVKSLDGC